MPDKTDKSALNLHQYCSNENQSFSAVYMRAVALCNLQNFIRNALGSPLGSHVSVANLNGQNLVLCSDSPAWASRLRFRIPDIYRILAEHGYNDLKSIRIKVIRPHPDHVLPGSQLSMSENAAMLVRHSAASIRDNNLRKSLERLGSHLPTPRPASRQE